MKQTHPKPMTLIKVAALLAATLIMAGLQNLQAATLVPVFTNLWGLNATNYDLTATGDNVRGAAINPVTTNVLYSTRAGGSNHVSVLDSLNAGAYLGALSGSNVSGGTVNSGGLRVADDGAVYLALIENPNVNSFSLYRWASDSDFTTPPDRVTNFVSTARIGDYMDVRGSGMDTEIIVSGAAGAQWVIFKPADTTYTYFTNVVYTFPGGTTLAGRGIAFDGVTNAFYAKELGTTEIRRIAYNLDPATNWVTSKFTLDAQTNALAGLDYEEIDGVKLLAYVVYGTANSGNLGSVIHRARVAQLTGPSNTVRVLDAHLPWFTNSFSIATNNANANGVGLCDFKKGRLLFGEPNNPLTMYEVTTVVSNVPPFITTSPVGNTNVLKGGFYSLKVSAGGETPLTYQWRRYGTNLAGETGTSLNLTNLAVADGGDFTVVVSNFVNGGSMTTSAVATVSVVASVQTDVAATLWRKPESSLPFLQNDSRTRSMAYHSQSNYLLVASRTGGTNIYVVDASTGNLVTNLNMTGVDFQTGQQPDFVINCVGVAEDGAIYACNLSKVDAPGLGGGFIIYRWQDADPATVPTVAYGADNPAGLRIGDVLAVTGSGANTRLLASTRSGTTVIVFTTGDGLSFSPNTVDVSTGPNPAPAGFAGLGLAAGSGDTFWATAPTFTLRKVVYDLVNGTNDVVRNIGGQSGYNIAVDEVNQFVPNVGTQDTPSNVRILDVLNTATPGVVVDQEFFGSDNDNPNGTGSVAVDVAGGRIFALDSNNGLVALKYAPRAYVSGSGIGAVVTWTGPGTLQSSTNAAGPFNDIVATSPYTNTTVGPQFYRIRR